MQPKIEAPAPNHDPLIELSSEDQLEVPEPKPFGKAGTIGILTLVSRCFGLLRDATIAYVLGTRAAADAFYVAFRIPNLLRRLLAEGNLTLSFIPVFTESFRKSPREAREVVDVVFTLLCLVLSGVTVLGVVGAGFFVRLTALGFTADPQKFALTVLLTKITFPYIFFVSLGALAMGVLNARKRFLAPAFAPVLLNVGIIAGALLLAKRFALPSVGIAWGVILGGALQLLIQIPGLWREGFLPRFNLNWRHPSVLRIGRLMLPSVYGSAVYQINLLAMTLLASYLPSGSISYLWYADRVMEFPLGIFAVSLATVVLPMLSEYAVERNFVEMKSALRRALITVWLINIPAAVGLAVLAKPIVAMLFFRGGFTQESTRLTSETLQCFALGLPFASATRITTAAFFAIQESRRPVRAANLAVLVNILAGLALVWPLQHRGLALAVGIGSMANFFMQLRDYRRQVGPIGLGSMAWSLAKMLAAALGMAACLLAVAHYWDWSFAPTLKRGLYVATMLAMGVGIYGVLILALRVEGTVPLLRSFRNKLRLG